MPNPLQRQSALSADVQSCNSVLQQLQAAEDIKIVVGESIDPVPQTNEPTGLCILSRQLR
jgi:hypothetical protein